MTSPQSLPVEEARKKFADLLDDSQFRNTHTAITRRGKTAGVVVPPEWYAEALEALANKRRKATGSPPPAVAAPHQQITQAVSKQTETVNDSVISPPVAAMSNERVKELAEAAEARHPEWVEEIRQAHPTADKIRMHYLIVEAGVREGFKLPGVDAASSEETSG